MFVPRLLHGAAVPALASVADRRHGLGCRPAGPRSTTSQPQLRRSQTAVVALAVSGDSAPLRSSSAGCRASSMSGKADNLVVIGKPEGNQLALSEALSGKAAAPA